METSSTCTTWIKLWCIVTSNTGSIMVNGSRTAKKPGRPLRLVRRDEHRHAPKHRHSNCVPWR